MTYDADEYLALSGVQHFAFCKRQWSLMAIDGVWEENLLTTLGTILHEKAHDESIREHRGDVIIVRGLRVISHELGLSGVCDVVEFHRDLNGLPLSGEEGRWTVMPVEYKRGVKKRIDADRAQVCAQALCLEEMMGADIPVGYLYYGKTHSREIVEFGPNLRARVRDICKEMHIASERAYLYGPKRTRGCQSCSLVDRCLPDQTGTTNVAAYIRRHLMEDQ